jgi:hypothetical protein
MNVWQRVYEFLTSHLAFFARTFGKAGALAYLGELVAHLLVLTTSFRLVDLPFAADWAFVVLGGYCAFMLWLFRSALVPRFADPEVRVVVTLFVTVSVLIHLYMIVVHSHDVLGIFGRGFSVFGVLYSAFLVLRLGTLETRITVGRARARSAVGAIA